MVKALDIRWRENMRRLLANNKGKVLALALSSQKGGIKYQVEDRLVLLEKYGVLNDAHAGSFKEVSF